MLKNDNKKKHIVIVGKGGGGGGTQVQSDWAQTDDTQPDYIKNKPEILDNTWFGTQAEYDAIVSKDPDIIYYIEDVNGSVVRDGKTYGIKVKIEWIEPQLPAEQTYFYIDNITNEENTITIKKSTDFTSSVTVYRSADKVNWKLMGTSTVQGISTTIPAYGRLYLKGTNSRWGQEESHYNFFTSTNLVRIGGYLSSLAIGDNYETNECNVPWSRTFYNWLNLVDAKDLILPNGNNWLYGMFEQSNIKTAPSTLPTVIGSCKLMFSTCKRLTTPPIMPATTLGLRGYESMFQGCTSLTTAPELPATALSDFCYYNMFNGCTSLTTAPAILPATTLSTYCYDYMFNGCTSLTTAPVLSATTLARECCRSMFQGCTALTQAPALPVTTLVHGCYANMFYNCTSLTTAPALPATTLASNCYEGMFRGCTSLTTAPALPATTLTSNCYDSMFRDCTSLTTAPALPATTLANGCYRIMFQGCTSLTTAPELPATTLADSCYNAMFYRCTSLTTAPVLPATTLVGSCYRDMFGGCGKLNSVTTYAQDISAGNCMDNWLSGVSSTGDFYNLGGATYPSGAFGIPTGWTEHTSL